MEKKIMLAEPICFKKVKNGVLDGIGYAKTEEYAEVLRQDGYKEIPKETYQRLMQKNLSVVYRLE